MLRAEITPEDIWQETLWCSWRHREQQEWRNLAKVVANNDRHTRVHDAASE
ncbi:MAG: hypothetical protein ACI91B_004423, partial [Planctomycetota bacterium]